MSDTFEEAQNQVQAWKPSEIRDAAAELVNAGLRGLLHSCDYFGPDNIPEDVTFEGRGTVGIATRMLIDGGVIQRSYITIESKEIYHGQRKSLRSSAHKRRIDLYTLVSRGMAEAWLKRNGFPTAQRQQEMVFA